MKRTFSVFVFALLLVSYPLLGQTVHQVSAGDETLKAAIEAAADGDIIELVDSGGLYTTSSTDKLVITKNLTIRAQEGLAQKPIIRMIKPDASSARHFEIRSGGRLTLIGLDLDGRKEDGGANFVKTFVRMDTDDSTEVDLFVYDCLMHNSKEQAIKGFYKTVIDTVVVSNCIIYDITKEGVLLYESSGNGPAVHYAEIENCTFYNIGREAIKSQGNDPMMRINHCTFDNCGGSSKRMVYPRDANDVIIKNSLFTNNSYSSFVKLYGNSVFSYNAFFNVGALSTDGNNVTVSDTMRVDPLYTDPANGDYTLQDGSPVLGMADDGFALGDLRWDPNAQGPTVLKVEAGDGTLEEALSKVEDGDIIELVTSGGVYSTSTSSSMKIKKKITIRAAEGLAQMPVLRNINTGTGTPIVLEIKKGGSLNLIGVEIDGFGPDGTTLNSKYLIRARESASADSFHYTLNVDGCYLHDAKEIFFKTYKTANADTVRFTNTLFIGCKKEGLMFGENSSTNPKIGYVEIENCTFKNIGREAMLLQQNPQTVVRINHCTFDSIATGGSDRILYPKEVEDALIKNCIFTNQGAYSESIKLYGNSSISYSDTFNVGIVKLSGNATIGEGMLGVDPLYNDPANNDYRLAESSPVRGAADDGRAMGDLRWEASPNAFRLTVITEGNGIVTLDPPGGLYDPGTVVTLTAIPDRGWAFAGWTGVVVFPPDNPVATITMDGDKTVTATFVTLLPKYTLQVDTVGLGHVLVEPAPVEGKVDSGTVVTFTAVPQENWHFVEWQGDLSGSENPIQASIDSSMHVIAVFASDFTQFTLTLEVIGKGNVLLQPKPVLGTYDSSTVVTLTAVPVMGWQFTGWSGDLTGTANPDSIVMDSDKSVTATFEEIVFARRAMEIDTTWDLKDAVDFANNNSSIDSLILISSGGVYTSTSTSDVAVLAPLTIVAAPDLAEKPILTNSDVEKSNLDILRVFDDLTVKGVIFDGGHARSHGMKYGIRLRHYTGSDSVKVGANITVTDCDFRNFYKGKDPAADGHAFKIDVGVLAGTVRFENCTFTNLGYEAIRISDTEKWPTDRVLDSLIVRNCTFTNIDAECVRYYSDLDPSTPDAPVLIEHITVNNSATRAFYLKNSGGAIVRDIIISNSRKSGHGRDNDLMDAQGNTGVPSFVSHIDTFKVAAVPIKSTDGEVDSTTIWGIDPRYEDPENLNYTLLPTSHLYGLAHDGEALGDLRWATNEPTTVTLTILVEGSGTVHVNPAPVGKTYDPGTVVTLTAIADSGWQFQEWSGDLSGTDNPATLTLDAHKTVTAKFQNITGVEHARLPERYQLDQNYPNPFNPTTTISFALKKPGMTTITVYDMLGRQVLTLLNRKLDAGYHKIVFSDARLSSGVYFYEIRSGEFKAMKKMILMK